MANLTSLRFVSEEAHDIDIGVPHRASVTPNDIRVLIENALDNGWNPTQKGSYTALPGILLQDYRTE